MYSNDANALEFISLINAYEPLIIIFLFIIVLICCMRLEKIKLESKILNLKMQNIENILEKNNNNLIKSNTIHQEIYKIILEKNIVKKELNKDNEYNQENSENS